MNNAYNNTTIERTNDATLPQNYQPTPDELKVLAQCRAESNMKGSISALLAGGLMYQSIKSFNLKVSPTYGAYPKVGAACLFGFFFGKLMSIPSCYEKFKNLPNSPLGAYMRQKRGLHGENLPMESLAQDPNLNYAVVSPSKFSDQDQMNSAIDIDVYSSTSNMDSYTGNELNGPEAGALNNDLPVQNYSEKSAVSYAELRRRNRDEYLRADKEKYNLANSITNDAPPAQPTRRSPQAPAFEEKNKYGDVWG